MTETTDTQLADTQKQGRRHSASDQTDFQTVHDIMVKHNVACDATSRQEMSEATSEMKEKCMLPSMGGSDRIPPGVISFAQLDAFEAADEQAENITEAASQFPSLVANIMADTTISDKEAALRSLAQEYADRMSAAMKGKSLWQKALALFAGKEGKEKPTKTEDGESFPAEAYAYAPTESTPSEWKIRLWETPAAKVTRAQLGRAAAAFSPGGFRGQKVTLPSGEVAGVKAKIRAAYT